MSIGIFPNVSFVSVNSVHIAHFRTGRLRNNPTQGRRRVVTKVQLLFRKVCDSWVACNRTLSRQNRKDFSEGHKSFGTNSTSTIHKSYAASRKHPKKQRSIARSDSSQKNLISAVLTFQNLKIGLRKRLRDKSDVPAEMRGSWPKVC